MQDARYHVSDETFTVCVCSGCGLRRTLLDGEPVDPERYYGLDYGAFKKRAVPKLRRSPSRLRARVGEFLFDRIHLSRGRVDLLRALRFEPAMKVLDVGCGTGEIGSAIAETFGCQVSGVEPSPEAAAHAEQRGLDVFVGAIEGFPAAGRFDVVLMLHSLEHVVHPRRVLEKVHDLLADDGRLLIAVPNAGGLERRLFGRHWDGWDIPRHVHHFDPRSLQLLLRETGLEPLRVYFEAYSLVGRSLGNLLYPSLPYEERKSSVCLGRLESYWGLLLGLARQSSAFAVLAGRASRRPFRA